MNHKGDLQRSRAASCVNFPTYCQLQGSEATDGHGAEPTSSFSALLARQLPMWAKWGYMFPYDAEVHAG